MAAAWIKAGFKFEKFFAVRDRLLTGVQLLNLDPLNARLAGQVNRELQAALDLSRELNDLEDEDPASFKKALTVYLLEVRRLYAPQARDFKDLEEVFSKTTSLISQIETYMRRYNSNYPPRSNPKRKPAR